MQIFFHLATILYIIYSILGQFVSEVESLDSDQDGQGSYDHSAHDYTEEIKRELKETIVMRIDKDRDGLISYEELKNHLAKIHEKNIEFNVNKQWVMYSPQIHEVFSWEGYEPETKEVLTWEHYFEQTYPDLVDKDIPGVPKHQQQDTSRVLNNKPKKDESPKEEEEISKKGEVDGEENPQLAILKTMAQRADIRWKLADENGDTLLTKQEFKFLLHPDEGNEELQALFIKEATEDMDTDKDGKISLDEFMNHLQVLASEQERSDQNWLSSQKSNYAKFLDKDKDGVLDAGEIKNWLVPSKSKKFENEATRLINIGDKNDDSKLSQSEILDNYEQFSSLINPEFWENLDGNSHEQSVSRETETREEL